MSSRQAALSRLAEFLDRVPFYAQHRSYDRPDHREVSRLSHWIRYRVITEEECVQAVLARHSFEVAEKFIQEILWRTYWKGWLEMRPSLWVRYVGDVERLVPIWEENPTYRAACEGQTDLLFFNDWVKELCATGYLHNHTRMWFASVWIFTLQLPWQLGAAFMFHHLLDADPASNTLSWRWVAGLHTPGKIYLARPDNIATFSEGRWQPKSSELVDDARPVESDAPVEITPLVDVSSVPPPADSLILIHDEDLTVDLSEELGGSPFQYMILNDERLHLERKVREHLISLRKDTANRCGALSVSTVEEVVSLVERVGIKQLHAFMPPVGYGRASVLTVTEELLRRGFPVIWHRRGWDTDYMPLARAGFFPFWQRVKPFLVRR